MNTPRVGGWGWAIFFLGWLGGAIGYFSLKIDDPRRANHVMKWALIATTPWLVFGFTVSFTIAFQWMGDVQGMALG